ncbi:MAG: PTS sugar transporter subunit IIA [Desulfobacterales bacterium]
MQLDLQEFAECLDMPPTTVERWIRQGRIPVRKRGNDCEFSQPLIEKWAESNHLKFVPPGENRRPEAEETNEAIDDLSSVMRQGGVFYDIPGENVSEVLWSAVENVPYFETPERKKALYESLNAREEMMSTGIGKGVAIPHPRTPMTESNIPAFITTCFLKTSIDYQAIDKKPVFVLFLLVSPSAKRHLHLLAQLSFCLRDEAFLKFLGKYPTPEELYASIADFSERIESSA